MKSEIARKTLQNQLFPVGIPQLWCPTLTHFRAAHEPDPIRIRLHLESLAPYVKGILVPGSTGEGWEMNDTDIRELLAIVVDLAASLEMKVLIGVLKTTIDETMQCMEAMQSFLRHPAVVGFTVCPAKGSRLSQSVIKDGLANVLAGGYPIALYQLPQITQNEMSPETVASLAAEFPNFILFKDTSGEDRVAKSGLDFGGVFMVRGSEQAGYSQWLRSVAGPYDGFLLSTANVFASDYSKMIRHLELGELEAAQDISSHVSRLVQGAFAIVEGHPVGNAFANSNKTLDHCFAYGNEALQIPPPLLYSGPRLPRQFIEEAMALLRECGLPKTRGYLT